MWDLKNKTVLITGGTNGIGKETALGIAKTGARVVIHGRSPDKTEAVVREIIEKTGNKQIDYLLADFSSLSDVRKLVEEFRKKYTTLHVLINNAGGLYMDEKTSKDGYDLTFAVNHLSHFLLTEQLLDLMKKSAPARIIHLSSDAYAMMKSLEVEKLAIPGGYGMMVYCAAKLCVLMYAYELSDRLQGTGVTSNALHPGMVKTGFGSNNHNLFWKLFAPVCFALGITPEKGALTSLHLATEPALEGVSGKFFMGKKEVQSNKLSLDKEKMKALKDLCEKLILLPSGEKSRPVGALK